MYFIKYKIKNEKKKNKNMMQCLNLSIFKYIYGRFIHFIHIFCNKYYQILK